MSSRYLLVALFKHMDTDSSSPISEKISSMSDEDINSLIRRAIDNSFKGMLSDRGISALIEVLEKYEPQNFSNQGVKGFRTALTMEVYKAYKKASNETVPDFREFDMQFQGFLESLSISVNEALRSLPGQRPDKGHGITVPDDRILELHELPCRNFGELDLDEISKMPTPAELSEYMIALVNYFKMRGAISNPDAGRIVELIEKMSSAPGYLRFLDRRKKYVEVFRLYRAIRGIESAGIRANPQRDDLMVSIGIILFNIDPSEKLVSYLASLKPSNSSAHLLYEYNAILALNYLLMGRLELASVHSRNAVARTWNLEKKAYIRVLQGCISIRQGDYDKAISFLNDASKMIGEGRLKGLISFYTGIVYFEKKDFAHAMKAFEESMSNVTDAPDLATIHNNIGSCALNLGDIARAEREFDAMEQLAHRLKNPQMQQCRLTASSYRGIISRIKGDYDRSVGHYKKALKMSIRSNDSEGVANHLGNMGIAYRCKGDYTRALQLFNACMIYSERMSYWIGIRFSYWHIYHTLIDAGKHAEAKRFKETYESKYPELQDMV